MNEDPEGTLEELLATRVTGEPVRIVKSRTEYDAQRYLMTKEGIVRIGGVSSVTIDHFRWGSEDAATIETGVFTATS